MTGDNKASVGFWKRANTTIPIVGTLVSNNAFKYRINSGGCFPAFIKIENAFRTLKTDLDLRPIYHKNDDATMAHLHLGILAYWLVNTVRYQLKANGINSCWSEIVRVGNTQKVITTSGTNTYDEIITTRKCTQPNENLKRIYDIRQTKHQPFVKRKSVVHKPKPKKTEPPQKQILLSG